MGKKAWGAWGIRIRSESAAKSSRDPTLYLPPRRLPWAGARVVVLAALFELCPFRGAADSEASELNQLKHKVSAQEATIRELLEWKRTVETSRLNAVPKSEREKESEAAVADLEAAAQGPRVATLQFHGFGDVSHTINDRAGDKNSFALGQLDFFLTSRLSDDLDVLGEVVIESGEDNEFATEIERLQINYRPSDFFNVSAGRFHTGIGYYNTAFHHGTWLQTAIGRPQIFEFEDDAGVLPIHNVGLSVSGQIPSGSWGLRYLFEVGNGRHYGTAGGPVLNIADDNDYKSLNVALLARPDGVPGLQAGLSAYHDTLTPEGLSRTDQLILTAHAVWVRPRFEWLNEVLWFRHSPRALDSTHAVAAYSQVSRRWGKWRPYLRYQYSYAQRDDIIFANFSETGLLHGPSIGIRFEFSELAALKLQYDRFWQGGRDTSNQFTTQVAFTF